MTTLQKIKLSLSRNWILSLYKLSFYKSLLILFSMRWLISIIIGVVFGLLGRESEIPELIGGNIFIALFVACIFAPISETFVFQLLPYKILRKPLKGKLIYLSIISGIIFGLVHYVSVSRMVSTAILGFCLQLWFVLLLRKHGTAKAFMGVTVVHSLMNLVSVMILYTILTLGIEL